MRVKIAIWSMGMEGLFLPFGRSDLGFLDNLNEA